MAAILLTEGKLEDAVKTYGHQFRAVVYLAEKIGGKNATTDQLNTIYKEAVEAGIVADPCSVADTQKLVDLACNKLSVKKRIILTGSSLNAKSSCCILIYKTDNPVRALSRNYVYGDHKGTPKWDPESGGAVKPARSTGLLAFTVEGKGKEEEKEEEKGKGKEKDKKDA